MFTEADSMPIIVPAKFNCRQEPRDERRADQLDHDVARDPTPRESLRSANAMLTAGFRCAPDTLP
jgi:hypothetical protein